MDAPDESTVHGIRDKAILETLYACGVRLAEIHGLDLADIHFSRNEILVRGKGSKERLVLFGRPTEEALRRYINESRRELLAIPYRLNGRSRYAEDRYLGCIHNRCECCPADTAKA